MKKAFWLLRKAVNVITVLGTLFCVFVNMDIIASAYSYFSASGDKTLVARFWEWVDSIYGEEKGSEIYFEVEGGCGRFFRHPHLTSFCILED